MENRWLEIIKTYLVDNDTVSEIETNGTQSIFIRKNGKREEIKNMFEDDESYLQATYKLATYLENKQTAYKDTEKENLQVDYLVEGRLDLGVKGSARVHIVLPPVSELPLVTIAKKSTSLTTLESIYKNNSISTKMYNFLKAVVDVKCTIVFSGSTGSGKTTFLEAMTKEIPFNTRIGVVEDSPELKLIQPNVCYLQSKTWKPGMDKNNEVTLDWCTRQINRMRTDLLIIGETRGKEFKEFITAANSGQEGSMTTLHANSPKLALQKMTQFIMEAQPQPVRVINKSIANTIDLVIQLEVLNGEYKVTAIEEISKTLGVDDSATITTTPLTKYDYKTKTWTDKFLLSGTVREKLEIAGYDLLTFTKRKEGNNKWH